MTIDDIKAMAADLLDVETRSIGTDRDASEAAQWVDLEKKTEAEADTLLDPAIKTAYSAHRKLTAEKKSLLEKLFSAKDRVRFNLANWIAGGHDVKGCYIKTTWKVIVNDPAKVPEEYAYRAIDEKALAEWVKTTEGKMPVPGCTIEQVNVLYAREQQ